MGVRPSNGAVYLFDFYKKTDLKILLQMLNDLTVMLQNTRHKNALLPKMGDLCVPEFQNVQKNVLLLFRFRFNFFDNQAQDLSVCQLLLPVLFQCRHFLTVSQCFPSNSYCQFQQKMLTEPVVEVFCNQYPPLVCPPVDKNVKETLHGRIKGGGGEIQDKTPWTE